MVLRRVSSSAIAFVALFSAYTVATTAPPVYLTMDSKVGRMTITEKNNSSDKRVVNIFSTQKNWNKLSHDVFEGSRGFTIEEAKIHAEALKSISIIKGKRFNI